MIGKTLSHYRVLEKIGAGGMGVVYRARDERLDRDVALKILPAGALAGEGARSRFRKEALALSRLSHPNIETVFDFDTQDGVDFLVMEFVPGISLDSRLEGGALPNQEVARVGIQLAQGLAAAHEQGVVHRDLKPANLRLTPDGRLKILDFGLARVLRPVQEDAPTQTLTQAAGPVGTLPYMAPERIREEKVDARSDIYSLGVTLYELATGRRPFRDDAALRLSDAILHEAPVPPRTLKSTVSPILERIILRCLEKAPEDRYQSAREVIVDLRRLEAPASGRQGIDALRGWWRGALLVSAAVAALLALLVGMNAGGARNWLLGRPSHGRIESLAVLPLANLSGDATQDYFADGMTDELITDLSKIGALRVISRTSVMRYKGASKPLPMIARELNVDAIIEGSVLQSGSRVRITAQLVEGATDRHLWARSYERDLRDVLALQDEVARAIAGEVGVIVSPQERARLAAARPVNTEGYRAYLKGRHFQGRRTEEGVKKSVEFFERAIEEDPGDALSRAALADSYVLLLDYGSVPPEEGRRKAKLLAKRAIEIDEALSEAHASLAAVLDEEWDWRGAEREYRRAIELDASNAHARHWYGEMLINLGRLEEARAEIDRAAVLDPLSPAVVGATGDPLFMGRQYDLAIEAYRKALQIDPNHAVTRHDLGMAYLFKGLHAEATAEIQKAIDLSGNQVTDVAFLALAHAMAGRKDEARRVLGRLTGRAGRAGDIPTEVAVVYAALGDTNRAFEWLEKAYAEQAYSLLDLKVNPAFDPLRSDPRFDDLARRIGLPLLDSQPQGHNLSSREPR